MLTPYDTHTTCSNTCNCIVKADINDDLNVGPETAEAINDAVRKNGGSAWLTLEEVEASQHAFSESDLQEAKEGGGILLDIYVPDCNNCGSDQ